MFYVEIRIKQGLSYISFCPLRIFYNSKFILMGRSLETNAVVVTRAHCTFHLNCCVRLYWFPLGVICMLCSVIVVISGHLLQYNAHRLDVEVY